MSFAALQAMGLVLQPNPYGCGWHHPMSVYITHCEDAHKHLRYPHVCLRSHPSDGCPCCEADKEQQS